MTGTNDFALVCCKKDYFAVVSNITQEVNSSSLTALQCMHKRLFVRTILFLRAPKLKKIKTVKLQPNLNHQEYGVKHC